MKPYTTFIAAMIHTVELSLQSQMILLDITKSNITAASSNKSSRIKSNKEQIAILGMVYGWTILKIY